MGIGHVMGFLFGALVTFVSRNFWLSTCEWVSVSYRTIEMSTCNGFSDFFFYVGIVSMVASVIGHFRSKKGM